jgi:hypothetical protein
MKLRTRAAAIVGGALAATTVAGVAAFATPPAPSAETTRLPAHMSQLDDKALAEMDAMMAGDATMGEMHQWMRDQGISLGQMHGDMARAGMPHGQMHRDMTGSGMPGGQMQDGMDG